MVKAKEHTFRYVEAINDSIPKGIVKFLSMNFTMAFHVNATYKQMGGSETLTLHVSNSRQ